LQDEILEQSADVIVSKGSAHRSSEPKATAYSARDIILGASLPQIELTRRPDTALSRVKPQHDLSEGNHVIFARTGWSNLESVHNRDFEWGKE